MNFPENILQKTSSSIQCDRILIGIAKSYIFNSFRHIIISQKQAKRTVDSVFNKTASKKTAHKKNSK